MKIAECLVHIDSLFLVLDAEQTELRTDRQTDRQTDGLKALMNIIYRRPRPPSLPPPARPSFALLVVAFMHINKPFPRLAHSSLTPRRS